MPLRLFSIFLFFLKLTSLVSAVPKSAQARPNWTGARPPVQFFGPTYQATVTGYGGGGSCIDPKKIGKCGFLGSGTAPQAAFSAGFNEPPQPGQCGTCWMLTAPKKLCYTSNAPPKICPGPNNVDERSQSGLIVLVTNTCAPSNNPSDTLKVCNQKNWSKDGLGSSTVVDLCMDTDAAKAWWNSNKAGLNVATIQRVNCSNWPGTMGAEADWFVKYGNYKGGPGYLPLKPAPKQHAEPQDVSKPLLATVDYSLEHGQGGQVIIL
ncbi:MAG: hypothetical protein LQ342_004475 [Letrouitia transgressa]|nr:MAG: hypothetical protein LQ342_004475 [Letrouitia transgressa]